MTDAAEMDAPGATQPGTARLVIQRSGPDVPWVGQMVPVDVVLWRPHQDTGEMPPFSLDDVNPDGAIAIWRPEAPPPEERDDGGVHYLLHHRTLLLFPETTTELTVPPLRARFDDASSGQAVHVTSTSLTFSSHVPHGLEAGDPLLVARNVTVTTTLDPVPAGLRVGDGFTRTITLSAEETDPLLLPNLHLDAPEGLRVYAAEPQSSSSGDRGQIHASRAYSATYVIDAAGHYELQETRVRFLDSASGKYGTALVPELSFWAMPNVRLGLSAFGSSTSAQLVLASSLILVALLGWFGYRSIRSGPPAWLSVLGARTREFRAYRAFQHASAHGPPLLALQKAYDWLAILLPAGPRTLGPLRVRSDARDAPPGSWEAQVFGGRPLEPTPPEVRRLLAGLRRKLKRQAPKGERLELNGQGSK